MMSTNEVFFFALKLHILPEIYSMLISACSNIALYNSRNNVFFSLSLEERKTHYKKYVVDF